MVSRRLCNHVRLKIPSRSYWDLEGKRSRFNHESESADFVIREQKSISEIEDNVIK